MECFLECQKVKRIFRKTYYVTSILAMIAQPSPLYSAISIILEGIGMQWCIGNALLFFIRIGSWNVFLHGKYANYIFSSLYVISFTFEILCMYISTSRFWKKKKIINEWIYYFRAFYDVHSSSKNGTNFAFKSSVLSLTFSQLTEVDFLPFSNGKPTQRMHRKSEWIMEKGGRGNSFLFSGNTITELTLVPSN